MDKQVKIKDVLTTIYEIHRWVQSDTIEIQEAYHHIRISLQSIFKLDVFSLFQYDYIEKRLYLIYGYGDPYNLLDAVNFRLGKGATRWIAEKKRSLLIPNAARKLDSSKKVVNSFLGVPIIFSGYLIGVVVVGSYRENLFGKEDKFLLEILTDYLGNLLVKSQWLPREKTKIA